MLSLSGCYLDFKTGPYTDLLRQEKFLRRHSQPPWPYLCHFFLLFDDWIYYFYHFTLYLLCSFIFCAYHLPKLHHPLLPYLCLFLLGVFANSVINCSAVIHCFFGTNLFSIYTEEDAVSSTNKSCWKTFRGKVKFVSWKIILLHQVKWSWCISYVGQEIWFLFQLSLVIL